MTTIAVLGPAGTFTDEAARGHFRGASISYLPTITDVFDAVASGKADCGVVPIENSTEGGVSETLECLRKTRLQICGEIYYGVHHVLAGAGKLSDVKRIASHPQAIAQCIGKLRKLKKLEIATTLQNGRSYTTAAAMAEAAKDQSVAAIGPKAAAERYGLKLLLDNLSDLETNETRFFVVSKKGCDKTGRDKTSLIVDIKHEAGSLYRLLGAFAEAGINLTRIESRPLKGKKWEYMFLIDFEGHKDDATVKRVLSLARLNTTYLKMLGSYPRG